MEVSDIVGLVQSLAWPAAVLVIMFVLKSPISSAIARVSEVTGPGWKIDLAVRRLEEQAEKVESVAREISSSLYELRGEEEELRDAIWRYMMDALNQVSPEAAYEMRVELNKYHLSQMNIDVIEVKTLLNELGLYAADESEELGFSSEIGAGFIDAVMAFQRAVIPEWVDGIVGSITHRAMLDKLGRSR
jgi:signal transduction histidine kinase